MSLLGLIALGAAALSGPELLVPKPIGIDADVLFSLDPSTFVAVGGKVWVVRNGVPKEVADVPKHGSIFGTDPNAVEFFTKPGEGVRLGFQIGLNSKSVMPTSYPMGANEIGEEFKENGQFIRFRGGVLSVTGVNRFAPSFLLADVGLSSAFCVARDGRSLYVVNGPDLPLKLTVYGADWRLWDRRLSRVVRRARAVRTVAGHPLFLVTPFGSVSLTEFHPGALICKCELGGFYSKTRDDARLYGAGVAIIDVKSCRARLVARLAYPTFPASKPSDPIVDPDIDTPRRHEVVALPGMDACAVTWFGRVYLIKGISSKK